MRALTVLLLASASLAPVSLMAQVQGAPQTAQGNAPRVHVEDGGVSEMMESIVVSAKPQAPFTLTLETSHDAGGEYDRENGFRRSPGKSRIVCSRGPRKQLVSGVETIGVRDARTYNPGVFGNDRKVTVEHEVCYSPQLNLNLLSTRTDPRTGKQTFTDTNVTLGDPDAALFELPTGFKVTDTADSGARAELSAEHPESTSNAHRLKSVPPSVLP